MFQAKEEVFALMADNDFMPFVQTRQGQLALWLARNLKEEGSGDNAVTGDFKLPQSGGSAGAGFRPSDSATGYTIEIMT